MLHWSQLNGFSPAHTEPKSFIGGGGGGGGSSGWQMTTTTTTMKNQGNRLTTVDLLVSLEEVLLDETHAALTALEGPLAWKQAQNRTHTARFIQGRLPPSGIGRSLRDVPFIYCFCSPYCVKAGVTGVDEDVSAEVVGASEGRRAVLANVRLVARRQAASISLQHH